MFVYFRLTEITAKLLSLSFFLNSGYKNVIWTQSCRDEIWEYAPQYTMKRVIISLQKAPRELKTEIEKQYLMGVSEEDLTPFYLANGTSFKALEVILDDTVYLIKFSNFKFSNDLTDEEFDEDEEDEEDNELDEMNEIEQLEPDE